MARWVLENMWVIPTFIFNVIATGVVLGVWLEKEERLSMAEMPRGTGGGVRREETLPGALGQSGGDGGPHSKGKEGPCQDRSEEDEGRERT